MSLDGENIVIHQEGKIIKKFPLHTWSSIISFSYKGASPALMSACVKRDIMLSFCTPRGKFLASVSGETRGNVLLRREQYRIADDDEKSYKIASNMIIGKLFNSRWSVERTKRDHKLRIDVEKLADLSQKINNSIKSIDKSKYELDYLRGIEGNAATYYFQAFDDMILNNKEDFFFKTRNRRPPQDNVNAMLSFAYALLKNDCASALESVGLDSYVGFLHQDRPGRQSLALDLMEELRPCFADRFVLTLINNRILNKSDFEKQDSGAVYLNIDGRTKFLRQWQEKKQETIKHPFLEEKINWGLVPYAQAMLLARYIRGDLDEYPPFLWK